MAEPVFVEDLKKRVDRLASQTIYCELLAKYYRTTAKLTVAKESEDEDAAEYAADLSERVDELKPVVAGLRSELDEADFAVFAARVP